MGYMKVPNLYKDQTILMFKEVYALQKVHGTSCHIAFDINGLRFFSGGAKHEDFIKLFDYDELLVRFQAIGHPHVTVYGEAYGGKLQGMSKTYGPHLKFVAFEVKIGDWWLSVPQAEEVVKKLGLEFVYYTKIPTILETIDAARDFHSVQAIRNGMGEGHKEEGVVLRPLLEFTKNNGERVIAKHKRAEFAETKTPRVVSPEAAIVLSEANEVADEWVTPMRLQHILGKVVDPDISLMPELIKAMIQDVQEESNGEIMWSKEVNKAISKKTAILVKEFFQTGLRPDPAKE